MVRYYKNTCSMLPPAQDQLLLRYECQQDNSVLGEDQFTHDSDWLKKQINGSLEFWRGEREARFTPEEERWKCRVCQFASVCPANANLETTGLKNRSGEWESIPCLLALFYPEMRVGWRGSSVSDCEHGISCKQTDECFPFSGALVRPSKGDRVHNLIKQRFVLSLVPTIGAKAIRDRSFGLSFESLLFDTPPYLRSMFNFDLGICRLFLHRSKPWMIFWSWVSSFMQ
ncbi:hypothetical protein L484_014413 [Morus notabilis]|uniref:Exonuclease V n=1 Tax=Morus notabilis TaxID=981085 RepID=W9RYJ8_9ROSA|nr:hypothetical protein L484_014413 [Morus notabilis]